MFTSKTPSRFVILKPWCIVLYDYTKIVLVEHFNEYDIAQSFLERSLERTQFKKLSLLEKKLMEKVEKETNIEHQIEQFAKENGMTSDETIMFKGLFLFGMNQEIVHKTQLLNLPIKYRYD